jgi:hypothetical protein
MSHLCGWRSVKIGADSRMRGKPCRLFAMVALLVLSASIVVGCATGPSSPQSVTTGSTSTALLATGNTESPETAAQAGSGAARHTVYAVGDDTQPGNEAVSKRLADLIPLPSDGLELFLYLGDVRTSGSLEDFARYDAAYGGAGHDLRIKTASLIGNHETGSREQGWIPYWNGSLVKPWPGSLTQTDPTYYTVKLGDWKFIILDTNLPLDEKSAQYAFLVAELKGPGYHLVVCGHDPRWSNGLHGNDGSLDVAWKAMCDYGALAYVSAHDHGSQIQPRRDRDGKVVKSGGCVQLVAGAGGAPLYSFMSLPGHAGAEWKDNDHFAIMRLTLDQTGFTVDFIAQDGTLLHSETFGF